MAKIGYINMCRAYYALMKARKSGVIVNVIGAAAQTRDPSYICGVAGNAALAAFTQSLGHASVQDGVRVVAIHPGPVATDRLVTLLRKRAHDRGEDPERWRELTKNMPSCGARGDRGDDRVPGVRPLRLVVTIDAGISARAAS